MNTFWINRLFFFLTALFFLVRCATTSSPDKINSSVLEPAEEQKAQEVAVNPNFTKLSNLLSSLGYAPVGMEYETNGTLELLYRVFSDPRTANRRIKIVYTGLQMSFEPEAEAITVGGITNVASIIGYIQKHVPLKGQEFPVSKTKNPKTKSKSRTVYKAKPSKTSSKPGTAARKTVKKVPPSDEPKIERAPEPSPESVMPQEETAPPSTDSDTTERSALPDEAKPKDTDSFEIPKDPAKPEAQ